MDQNEFWLELLRGKEKGRSYRLLSDVVTIGRALTARERKKNWILLDEPTISRIHAELIWDEKREKYFLSHKSRIRPTLVNDREVNQVFLVHHDKIQMGDVVFRFWIGPIHTRFETFLEEEFGEQQEQEVKGKVIKGQETAKAFHFVGDERQNVLGDLEGEQKDELPDRPLIKSRPLPSVFSKRVVSMDTPKKEYKPPVPPSADHKKDILEGKSSLKVKKYDFCLNSSASALGSFRPINIVTDRTTKEEFSGKKGKKILGSHDDKNRIALPSFSQLSFNAQEADHVEEDSRLTKLLLTKSVKTEKETSSSPFKPINLIQSRSVIDSQFFKESGKILGGQDREEAKDDTFLDLSHTKSIQKILGQPREDVHRESESFKMVDLIKSRKSVRDEEPFKRPSVGEDGRRKISSHYSPVEGRCEGFRVGASEKIEENRLRVRPEFQVPRKPQLNEPRSKEVIARDGVFGHITQDSEPVEFITETRVESYNDTKGRREVFQKSQELYKPVPPQEGTRPKRVPERAEKEKSEVFAKIKEQVKTPGEKFSPYDVGKQEVVDFLKEGIDDRREEPAERKIKPKARDSEEDTKRSLFRTWKAKSEPRERIEYEEKRVTAPPSRPARGGSLAPSHPVRSEPLISSKAVIEDPPKVSRFCLPDLWEILIIKGPKEFEGKRYGIKKDVVTLGKGLSNDITISDEQLANTHLKICFRDGKFFLEKLENTQPVFINGKILITGSGKQIQEGDKIQISNRTTVVFLRKADVSRKAGK